MSAVPEKERLHKVLAHAGIASRRKCEDLIREGRVKVNGQLVTEMGVRVDLMADVVELDGERVRPEKHIYLLLYKPRGVLCTTSDQFGRKTILDLIPEHRKTRLFTMGRLDLDAEGLVVVTNDGDFAHDVLHPRRKLPRTYWVKLRGNIGQDEIGRAREGVWLSDGRTPPMEVRVLRAGREISTAKCTLVERNHHQLKRIWARLGTPVIRMVLVRIATVGTEDLKKGAFRALTPPEVAELRSGAPGPQVDWSARKRRVEVAPETEGPVEWGAPADLEPDRPRSSDRASDRRRPPRGDSDRRGPPRAKSDRRGPPRGESDRRGPPRGDSDRRGPPRGKSDRRGPPRGESDQRRPPRGESDRRGPPRGDSDQRRPPRGESDQRRPPRGESDQRRPPRGESDQRRPPRGESDRRGPPRGDSDQRRPPRGGADRRGPPRADSDRRKPAGGRSGSRAQRGPRSAGSSSGRALRNRGRKS